MRKYPMIRINNIHLFSLVVLPVKIKGISMAWIISEYIHNLPNAIDNGETRRNSTKLKK